MIASADNWPELIVLAQDGEGFGRFSFLIAIVVIMAIRHVIERLKAAGEARQSQLGQEQSFDTYEEEDYYEQEPQGYNDPNPGNDTLLEFFRDVAQRSGGQVPPPPPPPAAVPPPPPRRRERTKIPSKRSGSGLSRDEQRALEKLRKGEDHLLTGRTHRQRMHSSAAHSDLGKMLRDPASLRNAFILKEVLEPPLAARDDQEPHKI